MARLYSTHSTNIIETDGHPVTLTPDVIWLDLLNPTPDEEAGYEAQLRIDLPMREELKNIEPSSRLYKENDALYMTATIVSKATTNLPEASAVGFLLHQNRLITIRYAEPKAFELFGNYLMRHPQQYTEGAMLLGSLLETIVDRAAEIMENVSLEIDGICNSIFVQNTETDEYMASGDDLGRALKQIAFRQNLLGKIRDSLVSLGRVVRFLELSEYAHKNHALHDQLKSVDRDISSLTDQASFLSANITFLLNASLGLISIEQNAIIKIFSVAAVAFLPPTLIASIYGMNFDRMPELHWLHGYPIAIGLMLLSAAVPYFWFKHKRWL